MSAISNSFNKIDNSLAFNDSNISTDFIKDNFNKYYDVSDETNPDSLSEKEEDPCKNGHEKENLIKIKKEENCVNFFLFAKGHKIGFYKGKTDTKIGTIIENYIKDMEEKEEIKNNFYYRDQLIDNDKTIKELNIENLGFISSK